MATHSRILAWRIPGTGDWWAAVYGVAQSRTRLSSSSSLLLRSLLGCMDSLARITHTLTSPPASSEWLLRAMWKTVFQATVMSKTLNKTQLTALTLSIFKVLVNSGENALVASSFYCLYHSILFWNSTAVRLLQEGILKIQKTYEVCTLGGNPGFFLSRDVFKLRVMTYHRSWNQFIHI